MFAGAALKWGSVPRCQGFLVWCGCTGRWSVAVIAGGSGCVVGRTLVWGGCPLLHRIRAFRVKERYLPSADCPWCPAGTCLRGFGTPRGCGAARGWAPGMFVDSWSGNCDHVGTDLRPGRWNGVVRLRFVDASQGWDAADSRRPATGMSTIMIGGDGLISECRWDVRRPMGRRALREV